MESNQTFALQLLELLKHINSKLPQEDIKNITEFIENREWGLAYETLCMQLYEYNTPISHDFYKKIFFLGKSIKIPSSICLPLKKLIINEEKSS